MKILEFKSTPGFGEYKSLFIKDAVKHPAKINLNLLKFLIENYTEEGEVILDPMAGTFSTSVMATILGRNSIGVELEQRFVDWGEQNLELANKHPTVNLKGKAIAVQGDSRELSALLSNKIDTVITSPPYDEGTGHGKGNDKIVREKKLYLHGAGSYSESKDNIGNLRSSDEEYKKMVDAVITSPPYSETANEKKNTKSNVSREERLKRAGHNPKDFLGRNTHLDNGMRYSHDPDNIGNLKHGEIDAVITSPPYANNSVTSYDSPDWTKYFKDMLNEKGHIEWDGKIYTEREWRKKNHGRIDGRTTRGVPKGEVGYDEKVDAVITSPPYSDAVTKAGEGPNTPEFWKWGREQAGEWPIPNDKFRELSNQWQRENKGYSPDKDNIGNLRHEVDAVIVSPPYADTSHDPALSDEFIKKAGQIQGRKYTRSSFTGSHAYSKDKDNIGNLKHEVDTIITSPPYEDQESSLSKRKFKDPNKFAEKSAKRYDDGARKGHRASKEAIRAQLEREGNIELSDKNVGKLKKQTYLEAMRIVYTEMFKVLKPNGKAIIVLKNFIRNKKVVLLTEHTITLMESIGFKLHERLRFKLPTKSFWRRLYSQKHPEVDVSDLEFEHILIFQKP